MKDHEYAMELYRIIKDYIILKMDGPDEEGYCYTLKSDAPPEVIEALGVVLTYGSKKYGDRNWEKGMPFSRYVDSAKRHLDKYIMGMTDEDHLAAAAWNIFAIMHHQELGQTELDDMPHYDCKYEHE